MGWYITISLVVLIVVYIMYNYNKIKNIEDVAPSDKIKVLNNKNLKQVTKSGLVLVDFWAPWCAPCKMIAPTLNEIAEENPDTITVAKVNVDQNQSIAQKYNIRNIPTMILFKGGKEIKRITGVKPKKALLKEIGLI